MPRVDERTRSAEVLLRLPEAMLARAGEGPRGSGWVFEPKLDGFRCLVCTHGDRLRTRSRRGWDMSPLLPELGSLPENLQLDGEIVALDENGLPDFHRLSSHSPLHKRGGIAVVYFVFDVLAAAGLATTALTYAKRRALMEELDVERTQVKLVATLGDGEALFDAVCARGLEGVVAKRLCDPYKAVRPV